MRLRFCFLFWLALASVIAAPASKPPFYADKQDLLFYLDARGERHPVRTSADWEHRRKDIVANMELVMGPLPAIDHRMPVAVEVLKEVRMETYTWRRITYAAEAGDRAYAYLYVPHGLRADHKTPAVVSLHGTTFRNYVPLSEAAPREKIGDGQYAQELAERGYVVIAPDYVFLGPDYKTDPVKLGYVSGTMKGIVNHIRAVDVLVAMAEVDPNRIAALGLSLGGHNSLFLAVFDSRIKAAVSSAGFNTFAKYYGGNLRGWTSNRYMPRIATEYASDPAKMPFDFTEVLAAIAPRAVFVNAPISDSNFEVSGVKDCVAAAQPVYEQIFGVPDQLVARYPEGGHGFAPAARAEAYAYLDRWLGR